ncbi:iron(III) transport system substrate-binding protein [Bosea sp. OK403]|uniref:ABC transporter substrate-binding protein n=1 Tax=Bosea sp. OK403 TaxID=1855286 RepID=UPI0008EB3FF4|nr:extracellular solute-binding protein [Bosea sp. OK403]SFJ53370.1 iron(III) transport system substrate-binding protein [Bosea sp. OK403]
MSPASTLTKIWRTLFACLGVCAASIAHAQDQAALEAAAKAEGRLTLYTSSVDAETQDIVKSFEARYPFIKVEWLRFPSTTLFTRFSGETAAATYHADVLYSGSSQLYQLRPELFVELTPEVVPNISKVIVPAKNTHYVVGEVLPHIVAYNTNTVSTKDIQEHLKSWKDLADPRWRGKIAMVDPKISTNMVSWLMLMRETYGEDWVKGFAANQFRVVTGGPSGAQQVAAGAFQMVVPSVINHSTDIRAQGAPIGLLSPDGPTHGLEMAMGLPVKAPHPNAARLYVNWKLGRDAALLLCKIGGVPNVPAPTDVPCPTMSARHVGSNDMITPEQQKDVLSAYGLKP